MVVPRGESVLEYPAVLYQATIDQVRLYHEFYPTSRTHDYRFNERQIPF
jgi:hypothetical protein